MFASKNVATKSSPLGWMTTEKGQMTSKGSGANVVTGTTAVNTGHGTGDRGRETAMPFRDERFAGLVFVFVGISQLPRN